MFNIFTGKTFVAPWSENLSKIENLFPINVRPSNGNKAAPATLCQWSEVLQHPGLVLCLTHTTGLPIMLMLESRNISVSILLINLVIDWVLKTIYKSSFQNFFILLCLSC